LYDDAGVLSGVLDLDATHLNYRIADFALAWRGDEDEVIEGYEEISPLSELEWEMLLPTYWAWLFYGVKESLRAILASSSTGVHFEWQTRHFSKRSKLIERLAPTYPGRA
jgi:Ser/Thr protein kinase RdoA (MazF antagonist)